MSVYYVSGNEIATIFDVNGSMLAQAYDIDGIQKFPNDADPYLPDRTLIFEDNFDGNTLDSTKWGYELGDVRNNESQTYRAENNVSVENGSLVITAKKEDFGTKHWTSGSITGQHKFEFTYGRVEAKIKFPDIPGSFPAFWLLGANMENIYHEIGDNDVSGEIWPKCGEVDIVEITSTNRDKAKATVWTYTGAYLGGSQMLSGLISVDDWNIYACEWTSEYIAMSVNGTEYARWTFSDYSLETVQAYHLPFYIILNLAVGSYGGTPAASTIEMKMYVDWVRVYEPLNLK